MDVLSENDCAQIDSWLAQQIKANITKKATPEHPTLPAAIAPEANDDQHAITSEVLIKWSFTTLTTLQKKQFIHELLRLYLRFTPAAHLLGVALLLNHFIEQWLQSNPNSQKVASLPQSVNNLLKSNFR